MEKTKATIMAGFAARSNMGFSRDIRKLRRARFDPKTKDWELISSVMHFCGEFMENEVDQDNFMEEAQSWYESFLRTPDEEFYEKWNLFARCWLQSERQRFRKALEINNGASNPVAIASVLHEATLECNDEWLNSGTDPAVRLILHQLAHLCDIPVSLSLSEYREIVKACEEHANKSLEEI